MSGLPEIDETIGTLLLVPADIKVQTIPLLCVKDVASSDYLDTTEDAVYVLLQTGKLRGTRIGPGEKLWRTTPEWVRDYLERKHGPAAPKVLLTKEALLIAHNPDEAELMKATLDALVTLQALQERLRIVLEARMTGA